jgi:hypothetical protein
MGVDIVRLARSRVEWEVEASQQTDQSERDTGLHLLCSQLKGIHYFCSLDYKI